MAAYHPRVSELRFESRRPSLTIEIPPRTSSTNKPIRLTRRSRAYSVDITARKHSSCESCCGSIEVGDRVTKVTSAGAVALAAGLLPQELESIISKNLGENTTIHHPECAQMNGAYKTQSGRVSQKPVKLGDESFIAGSGFSGCDTYDRGYDRGIFYDRESIYEIKSRDDTGFIVEDEEPPMSEQHLSDDEEEWESGEDTDDSDQEWDESM